MMLEPRRDEVLRSSPLGQHELETSDHSTTASPRRMPLLWKCRLPISGPTKPPTPAAMAHSGRAPGRYRRLAKLPASPAMELTRMKAAEVPDIKSILAKLGAQTNAEALDKARDAGLLS
jgi:hypothetical protein